MPAKWCHHKPETKAKISAALTGRVRTETHRANLSAARHGSGHSTAPLAEVTCSKCSQTKPVEMFVKNKSCRGGVAHTCKECMRAYRRLWSDKNHDRLADKRRRDYAERYKPIAAEKERLRAEQYPIRCRAQRARSYMLDKHKKHGVPFDSDVLTVPYLMDLFKRSNTCECCGKDLLIHRRDGGELRDDSTLSVDRFIPALGYVPSNLSILCWRCNNLKRDATAEELEKVAAWMRSKQGNEATKFDRSDELPRGHVEEQPTLFGGDEA